MAQTVTCPNCRAFLRVDAPAPEARLACPRCRGDVPNPRAAAPPPVEPEAPVATCSTCGARLVGGWGVCPVCEARAERAAEPSAPEEAARPRRSADDSRWSRRSERRQQSVEKKSSKPSTALATLLLSVGAAAFFVAAFLADPKHIPVAVVIGLLGVVLMVVGGSMAWRANT